jgi:hypothetical protein
MEKVFLHKHRDFSTLLRILGAELQILPALVEKDYWLMHVLYGLKEQGFTFELKGGTSLSKGYRIIERFSEDIDIYLRIAFENCGFSRAYAVRDLPDFVNFCDRVRPHLKRI